MPQSRQTTTEPICAHPDPFFPVWFLLSQPYNLLLPFFIRLDPTYYNSNSCTLFFTPQCICSISPWFVLLNSLPPANSELTCWHIPRIFGNVYSYKSHCHLSSLTLLHLLAFGGIFSNPVSLLSIFHPHIYHPPPLAYAFNTLPPHASSVMPTGSVINSPLFMAIFLKSQTNLIDFPLLKPGLRNLTS